MNFFYKIAIAAALLFTFSTASSVSSKEVVNGVQKGKAYFEGYPMDVVDLHFHPSSGWKSIGPLGKKFILSELPGWLPELRR